jgi:hypothetical protein
MKSNLFKLTCLAVLGVATVQVTNYYVHGRGEEPPKAKAPAKGGEDPAVKKLEPARRDDPDIVWHKLDIKQVPDSRPGHADFDVEVTAWYGGNHPMARGPKGVAVPKGPIYSRAVLRVEVYTDETATEQILGKDLKTFALPAGKFEWKSSVSVSLGKVYGKAPIKPQLVVFTLSSTVPVTYHGADGSSRVTTKIFAEKRFRVARDGRTR